MLKRLPIPPLIRILDRLQPRRVPVGPDQAPDELHVLGPEPVHRLLEPLGVAPVALPVALGLDAVHDVEEGFFHCAGERFS